MLTTQCGSIYKTEQGTKGSSVRYHTNCFAACDIYPYTHTNTQGVSLWKHPCKYLPLCLLCFYSSHPRIVSFFLHVLPSCLWLTTRSGNHNSVSLIPLFFPFAFFSVPKEQLSFPLGCVRVCVREHAVGGIPLMSYYGDSKYQAGWPECCMMVYLAYSELSWADCDFFVIVISPWRHSDLSGYFRSTLFGEVSHSVPLIHPDGTKSRVWQHVGYSARKDACDNGDKDGRHLSSFALVPSPPTHLPRRGEKSDY